MPGFNIGTHRFEVPWLKFDVIGQALSSPDNRLKLLKFLLYRQAPGDTGARGMVFCVNKEVPALGPAPLGGVAAGQLAAAPAAQPGGGGQAGERGTVPPTQR